jgi:RND family efflux transporter MFP subunit
MSTSDLSMLSRGAGGSTIHVPRPRSRLVTRVLLPAFILLGTLGVLAYAMRASLRPAVSVRVAPAVPHARGGAGGAGGSQPAPGEIVQAPGWIEADPYAESIAALAPGVVKELTVLEGDRVSAGQLVARLVDEDAALARKRAAAEVERMEAGVREAGAAVAVEEARLAEAQEALSRIEPLAGSGTVAEEEIVQRRLRLASQRAAVETARSAVARAESEASVARVALEDAELTLSRMRVTSPVAGVVLARMVEPGQRVMLDANNPYAGVVLRLYDPKRLQVRVDIPLADAAKVHEGDAVEVTTETMPDRVFHARVTRFVHEADIQKNTVQVKAAIADPAPELKPEMLAKARIQTAGRRPAGGGEAAPTTGAALLVPGAAIVEASGRDARAWILDQETSTAVLRRIKTGRAIGKAVEVLDGLRPGDRVILAPPADIREGMRIAPVESKEGD